MPIFSRFGADFFTVWCRFFHGLYGEKKNISLLMIFSRLAFHGLPPLEKISVVRPFSVLSKDEIGP